MNWIDVAIIVILVLSVLIGITRGFIASFLSLAGWILAIVLNHNMFPYIEPFLEAKFKTKILVFIVGYACGLLLLLFVFSVLNFSIITAIGKGHHFDKALGGIFGFVRGLLLPIVMLLCFEIGVTTLQGEQLSEKNIPLLLLNAKSFPLLKEGEETILELLPDVFTMKLYSYVDVMSMISNNTGYKGTDDITMLNIIRKLSVYASADVLSKVEAAANQDSKYMSKRQVRVEKIKKLWQNYMSVQDSDVNNNVSVEKLSQQDVIIIKKILRSG